MKCGTTYMGMNSKDIIYSSTTKTYLHLLKKICGWIDLNQNNIINNPRCAYCLQEKFIVVNRSVMDRELYSASVPKEGP